MIALGAELPVSCLNRAQTGSEVILTTLINSSHQYHFDWKIGDKCATDFQNMRDRKTCETVFGDNSNVIIYLLLSDFLWASTSCVACSEDSPLIFTTYDTYTHTYTRKVSTNSEQLNILITVLQLWKSSPG